MNDTTLETLTANDVLKVVSVNAFQKANKLIQFVQAQTRQGQTLKARVADRGMYDVEATLLNGYLYATCDCGYTWHGSCKHVGALLLKWVNAPASFSVKAVEADLFDSIPSKPLQSQKPKHLPDWIGEPPLAGKQASIAQLKSWLQRYRLQDMRDIAKRRKWRIRGTRKAEVAEQLSNYMSDAQQLAATLSAISAEPRATLNALAIAGNTPTISNEQVLALATRWHKQPAALHDLPSEGIAVEPSATSLEHILPHPVMPDVMMSGLQPHLDLIEAVSPPSSVSEGDPAQFLQKIGQLLLLLEQKKQKLTNPQSRLVLEKYHDVLKGWRYDAAEIRKLHLAGRFSPTVRPDLTVPPPEIALNDSQLAEQVGGVAQLNFYYHLLQTAGLVCNGSPIEVWRDTQLHYVQMQPEQQFAMLVHQYFEMADWNELWEVLRPSLSVRLQRGWHLHTPAQLDQELQALRKRVLRLLACLPDGQWLALADIEALLQLIWQKFDATATQINRYASHKNPNWHVKHLGGDVAWERGQRPFMQQVITALHWLGLADIGRTDDQITHIQLRGLADLFWNRALVPIPQAAIPTEEAISSQGTSLFVKPNGISGAAHTFLDTIARLVTTEPTRFGYELDANAVYTTFEEGITLPMLLEKWQTHFSGEPPASIKAQLESWWTHYGEIRLYDNVALIEFVDDYALAEMQAVTSLNDHLIAKLAPRVVLIENDAITKLANELQQAGYTPKIA